VKPHFVERDPGIGAGQGGYAIFVGRLSEEKGVRPMLDAWSRLHTRVPLTIVGDGPLSPLVAEAASRMSGVNWIGRRSPNEVQTLVRDAAFLVFPSVAYETFGQVIVEAYAAGTPVIASRDGAAAELVEDGRTGFLVQPGDAADIVAKVERLLACEEIYSRMRIAARGAYETHFTAEDNYLSMMAIYRRASKRFGGAMRRWECATHVTGHEGVLQ
jgi:glycosyltransferase involved in cell wall biosynthesis